MTAISLGTQELQSRLSTVDAYNYENAVADELARYEDAEAMDVYDGRP